MRMTITLMDMNRAAKSVRALMRFGIAVAERYVADRCPRTAGALAFTTVLAIVPMTAVGFAVLSVVPAFKSWMASVQTFLYGNLVPAAGEVVSRYIQQFAANAGRLTVWGLAFLFFTAVMLIATIEQAFNDIWHVRNQRKLARRFVSYWAVIILGPVLMGLSLSITSYIGSLSWFGHGITISRVRSVMFGGMPIVFEWITFVLLYAAVPHCSVKWKHAYVGATVATVLFELAKHAFGLFVASVPTYRAIYGAIAALPVFLIWIYFSWVITLLGAQVTAAMPRWREMVRS